MIDAVTAPSTGVATGLNNWLNVTLGRRATYLHRQYEKIKFVEEIYYDNKPCYYVFANNIKKC